MANPFTTKHPADPAYFVGRQEVVDSFLRAVRRSAALRPPKPDNIAVVGGWGLGKSSVLSKFEQLATSGLEPDIKAFTAFVELTPVSCTDFATFSTRVREEIERSFRVSDLSLVAKLKQQILPNWRLKSIDLGVAQVEKDRGLSPLTSFEESLRSLWALLEKNGINLAVLMLDDLQYLASRYPDGLYDLRGVFQRLPRDGCNFMLAVSGYPALFEMARELAEPFSRFFDRHLLKPFSLDETAEAIQKPLSLSRIPLKVDRRAVERIHAVTGGHPYFLSFVMQDMLDLKQKGALTVDFLDSAYPRIAEHLAREKFSEDLSLATDVERRILLKMSHLPDGVSPSRISVPNSGIYLKNLVENRELVAKVSRGKYSIYHPMFKEYLRGLK